MDLFAPNHIILILLIVLLLFGGKKIPELMRGLGKGVKEFNDAKHNIGKQIEEESTEKDTVPVNGTVVTHTTTPL